MDGVRNNIWLNYYSSVLCCAGVKCGLLCKNDDRPFLKNCPPTTLKGLDVTVTHLSFPNSVFFFSLVDRVCVGGLGCSARVGESKRF